MSIIKKVQKVIKSIKVSITIKLQLINVTFAPALSLQHVKLLLRLYFQKRHHAVMPFLNSSGTLC